MLNLKNKLEEFQKQGISLENSGRESTVLIVDALNSYVRCFIATPTMNDDGAHIGGVTGFLKSVGLAVRQFKPSRVILVFDGRGGSKLRRNLYSEYKNNRKPTQRLNRTYNFNTAEQEQESMKWQIKLLIDICKNLPVSVIAMDDIEADDVIAYITNAVADLGGNTIIMSTDKDFLQLVRPGCFVYNPIKKKIYNEKAIIEEYGIHPNNFLVYRVLDGDKSDNIPGIKGIGLATLKKNIPEIINDNAVTFDTIFNRCKTEKSLFFKKILNGKSIIERNIKLMCLRNLDLSGQLKIQILEQFNRITPQLNKLLLTKLFLEYKLFGAFGNYDEWIMSTWTPLTRYSQSKD